MNEDKLDALTNDVAEILLKSGDALQKLVADLPDQEVLELAHHLEHASQENCHGFRVRSKDDAARTLRAEVHHRQMFARARVRMEETGETSFCFTCDGPCRSRSSRSRLGDARDSPQVIGDARRRSHHAGRTMASAARRGWPRT